MALEQTLTQLEGAQLVRQLEQVEATYQFRHTLTQETVYQSLLRSTRREVHLRVAQAYEEIAVDQLDEFAALLAQHYGEAGEDAKTLEYATRAGNAAARVYAHTEAETHYARAIEIAKRGAAHDRASLQDLFLKRGRVLELSGRYDDALANYAEMETGARAQNDRALELAALMARATIHSTPTARYNLALGRELLDRALALARTLNEPAAESKALWTLMLVNYFQSNYDQAIACGEQSLAIARQLNLREQMAFTLNDLSRNYIGRGRATEGRAVIAEARALWRELGNLPMLADSLATSAEGYFFLGDYTSARELAQEAYQLSKSIGNLWNQAFSRWAIGYLALERGDIEESIHALQDAIDVGKQSGFIAAALIAQGMLGWVYGLYGNLQQGIEIIQAISYPQDISIGFEAWHLGVLAQLHLAYGDLAQAEAIIQRAYVGLDLADLTWFSPIFVMLADGEIAMVRQEYARVIALTDQLLKRMRELNMRPFVSDVLLLKAKALRAQGNLEAARALLIQAREDAQALESRRALWEICATLSQVEAACGNHAQAITLRAQAREIIAYIVAHTPTPLRESFLGLPTISTILAGSETSQL
ncbi:hypothetical protein ANRL4_03716 [Anaerolineae bacterium]|nr:hypothetical protein ANRL4_03716 [Anaerolineae bacterium]